MISFIAPHGLHLLDLSRQGEDGPDELLKTAARVASRIALQRGDGILQIHNLLSK